LSKPETEANQSPEDTLCGERRGKSAPHIEAHRNEDLALKQRQRAALILWPFGRLAIGATLQRMHLPFNFHLISNAWTAAAIAALVEEYEAALPLAAWPNWVLGNHDQKRIAARSRARGKFRSVSLAMAIELLKYRLHPSVGLPPALIGH
jgi:Alpha amylase, catalytic domain